MKNFTFNVINTTAIAAKTLALTIKMGEHRAKSSGNFSATVVAKDKGTNLAKTRIQLLDCTLIPSKDFVGSNHAFDVLVSTWNKDLMWWNRNRTRVATSILSVQFWHSKCTKQIKHFKSPASVSLRVKEDLHFNISVHRVEFVVPKNYRSLPKGKLESFVKIRRVGVPKGASLHVKFHEISAAVDVVITKMSYPSYDDFANSKTVSESGFSWIVSNDQFNDIWCYLAVLPSEKIVERTTDFTFKVSFTIRTCLAWDVKKSIWKPSCQPGKQNNPDVISCSCRHFSVFAGYIQNVRPLYQRVITEEVELEFQSCYVIFITVAVTFLIYCLLLISTAFKYPSDIYYLADNAVDERYAYLIVVRTENIQNAGTTSKVVIRLVGSKRSSLPHVLNHPDPDMHILQKQGQDKFVLTTKRHLGAIKSIELWFDSSGASPSWNCRDILIFDLQTVDQWYFKIKRRFDVVDGVTYLALAPTTGAEAEQKKFFKRFRVCNQFHTWLLFVGEPNFPFVARITVVLSTVLMGYTFLLLHFPLPAMDEKDCLDEYEYYRIDAFSVYAGAVSFLLAYIIHIGIAWTFRFSDITFSVFSKEYKSTHKMSVLCWILLIILISTSMSFLIICGFWMPKISSYIWLTCCLIGILFTIVVFENVCIIIQTYFCKFKMTFSIENKVSGFLKVVEEQRKYLYEKFDTALLRPFFQHLYKPLEALDIKRRQILVKLRRGIYDDLEDLLLYGIYNIILYIVILYNRGTLTIISKTEIESMMNGLHTRSIKFTSLKTPDHIYQYLNTTLIPSMHPTVWYGNYGMNDPGSMIDNANKFVGVARLRQHRLIADSCNVPRAMKFLNMTCWPEFSIHYEETEPFGYGWGQYKSGMEFDRMKYIWKYHSSEELGTLTVIGSTSDYPGGGYVAFLGRTLRNSYTNFQRLYETYWIDDKSRSIFIEFLTYNANYNIFNSVRLIIEQSATGYVLPTFDISPVRMLFVENEVEQSNMVIFIIFVIWVMMLMFKLSIGIAKNIRTFYKKVWLMIDLLINSMSVICIIIFLIRMKMIKNYLRSLEEVRHNQFVSYFSLFYVEDFLTMFAALLICIATARLWRFLRFGQFFKILERTLSMSAFPLVSVTLAFSVVLLAFGLSGVMIFGNDFTELSTLMKILATLIQLTLKPEDYPLPAYAEMDLGYAYFSVYLLLMQIILFVYIIVIIMAYTKAQLEFSVVPDGYTVGDYISSRLEYIPKLLRHKCGRLRGGFAEEERRDEEPQPVTPKADEFRYANCIGVPKSRMQAMRFIVSCLVANTRQTAADRKVLSSYETEMMLGVCNQFVLKTYEDDELELFFKGHFEGETFRVVDEKRIIMIASFAELMFQMKKEREEGPRLEPEFEQCVVMIKKNLISLRCCNLMLKLASINLDSVEKNLGSVLDDF